jgi:DNA mismatch endonuclease (patch repair protein)
MLKRFPDDRTSVFGPKRLAVFVDGAFWHGRADRVRPGRSTYWDKKIARNQTRDRSNELKLRERGWNVLRLWDDEVLADPEAAALRVLQKLNHYPAAEFSSFLMGDRGPLRS